VFNYLDRPARLSLAIDGTTITDTVLARANVIPAIVFDLTAPVSQGYHFVRVVEPARQSHHVVVARSEPRVRTTVEVTIGRDSTWAGVYYGPRLYF
jgi:hypothetical protein